VTLEQDLELLAAERDAMAELAGKLLALIKRQGGYLKAEDQELLRWARARLVEQGRRVSREDL
jgi:hypothetical protein